MMLPIDWSQKVAPDYRTRIVIDPNHPILAFKASRDRYTNLPNQLKYAGLPYLGSSESEDALTWNVFRSLQKVGGLNIISNFLGIGETQGLLLWTLAPAVNDIDTDLQYKAGELTRRFDGVFRGQMTEPDVILLGTRGVAIIECKLSESDKTQSHLWEGELGSVEKRLPVYLERNSKLLKYNTSRDDVAQVYQLVRMAFYAVELGGEFGVQPVVVSLANRGNWSRRFGRLGKSASDLWDMFRRMLGENSPICKAVFWQESPELIRDRPLETLSSYILTHPCLRTT